MAVARASLRQKLCAAPSTLLRPAAPTSPRSCFSSGAHLRARPRRMIPEDCKAFYKSDGTLLTTQANVDFLREHDIEHDTAEAIHIRADAQVNKTFQQLGVNVTFTPRHLIHPSHLHYFDPRGHPLIDATRARYTHMARTQPLWLITTCNGSPKAAVRLTATKRLRAALYMALQAKGYHQHGTGDGKVLRGTLWIHIQDPVKAASQDKEVFGEAAVRLLESASRGPRLNKRSQGNAGQKAKTQRSGRAAEQAEGNYHRPGGPTDKARSAVASARRSVL